LLYFEPHIEQGPVLEAEGLAVGIVTGISAQTRLSVEVRGEANHAGTTPMPLRRDALAAAAEAMLALEAIARRRNIVGTVGAVQAFPGLGNVVPGRAVFTVDLRAPRAEARDAAEAEFRDALAAICAARGVSAKVTLHQRLAPCFCDEEAQALLAESLRDLGLRPFWLASGAGHDGMSVATLAPVAMLFIRCAKGISHNPAEAVMAADVEIAAQVMLAFLTRLAVHSRLSLG
jgi:allantoate deiminase